MDRTHLMSMTGYGISQVTHPLGSFRCEVRSVNSRFLEVQVKSARGLIFMEHRIASFIRSKVERGKVDLFLDIKLERPKKTEPRLDEPAQTTRIDSYLELYSALEKKVRHRGLVVRPLDLQRLLSDLGLSGAFGAGEQISEAAVFDLLSEEDRIELEKAVMDVVHSAVGSMLTMRQTEGMVLGGHLRELLQEILSDVKALELSLGAIREDLKEQHKKRLLTAIDNIKQLADQTQVKVHEDKIIHELAILQDKQDITEEWTRLKLHVDEMEKVLAQKTLAQNTGVDQDHQRLSEQKTSVARGQGVGKKLDFLCQEMFREINTMSNKLFHSSVLQRTVQMKQQVERVRQQVQNIE